VIQLSARGAVCANFHAEKRRKPAKMSRFLSGKPFAFPALMHAARHSKLSGSLLLSLAWFALLGTTHCAGKAESPAQASGGAAGSPAACHSPLSTPVGRPQSTACPATSLGGVLPNSVSCNTASDCADAGLDSQCLNHQCGLDQCLTDSDCAAGTACQCSNTFRGNARSGNACVPTGCRVDADCGPGGACSPDTSGRCGSVSGFHCHTAADTCHSDSDCCGTTPKCAYQAEVGDWECIAVIACNG